jgi:carbamate kinase
MKPKIEAIVQFLEAAGKKAVITSPQNLLEAYRGKCGTTIVK